MNRKFTFLGLFVLISILMGYPMYYHALEGDVESLAIMAATYLASSVLIYAVYTGKIKTGTSVALREKYARRRKKTEKRPSPIRFLPKGAAIHGKNTPADNPSTEK